MVNPIEEARRARKVAHLTLRDMCALMIKHQAATGGELKEGAFALCLATLRGGVDAMLQTWIRDQSTEIKDAADAVTMEESQLAIKSLGRTVDG